MSRVKVYDYIHTYVGARIGTDNVFTRPHARRTLPPSIDSITARWNHSEKNSFRPDLYETLSHMEENSCIIKRPEFGYSGYFLTRLYHAWLVLTNKAGAWQYTRDQVELADKRGLYRYVDDTKEREEMDD